MFEGVSRILQSYRYAGIYLSVSRWAFTMGTVDIAALVANAVSFGLLWAYRHGDSNMRSAWICTRNDVIGNLAVLVAAAGVFGTGTGWLAAIMAGLALQGATIVVRHAFGELRQKQTRPLSFSN